MSTNTESGSGSASGREVARRVFADEFNDATYMFTESDDELAPNYALLPTGERANRVFIVGTLTETADVGSDAEYWQGRVVDPTGSFYVYAGQYQPDAARVLRELDPPGYVAVVGKPGTYETDEGYVNVSVRPESITQVDEAARDRWVIETGEQTIQRLEAFAGENNEYARMAREEYGEMVSPYREAVIDALESLEVTTDSASARMPPSEGESDASASDSLAASDTEPGEADELSSTDSGDSTESDESIDSIEKSAETSSDIDNVVTDSTRGEYD